MYVDISGSSLGCSNASPAAAKAFHSYALQSPARQNMSQLFQCPIHAHASPCMWVLCLAAALAASLAAFEADDGVDTVVSRMESQRCSAEEDSIARLRSHTATLAVRQAREGVRWRGRRGRRYTTHQSPMTPPPRIETCGSASMLILLEL